MYIYIYTHTYVLNGSYKPTASRRTDGPSFSQVKTLDTIEQTKMKDAGSGGLRGCCFHHKVVPPSDGTVGLYTIGIV